LYAFTISYHMNYKLPRIFTVMIKILY